MFTVAVVNTNTLLSRSGHHLSSGFNVNSTIWSSQQGQLCACNVYVIYECVTLICNEIDILSIFYSGIPTELKLKFPAHFHVLY